MNRGNCYDYYFQTYTREMFGSFVHWHWLKALAIVESQLDPDAMSVVGALGVMQLMPVTAGELAAELDLEEDLLAPHNNIRMGVRYARKCWSIFKEEAGLERVRFMIGAYNAGPGHIIKAQKLLQVTGRPTDQWSFIAQVLHLVTGPHSVETVNHVARVEKVYNELHKQERDR